MSKKTTNKSPNNFSAQKGKNLNESIRRSSKTPQVLRLVTDSKKEKNPVLAVGKSRIPVQLRGREPLSRIIHQGIEAQSLDSDDKIVVNITELAIEQEAPKILDRFNACSCNKCVEFFSKIISAKVPAQYARISKSAIHRPLELTERVEPARKKVIAQMIRELIGNKKRCFHDE